MVEDTTLNSAKCICKSCPSKNECMNNAKEWLYCAKGKSKCSDIVEKGCVCDACPIATEFNLEDHYYCVKGKTQ